MYLPSTVGRAAFAAARPTRIAPPISQPFKYAFLQQKRAFSHQYPFARATLPKQWSQQLSRPPTRFFTSTTSKWAEQPRPRRIPPFRTVFKWSAYLAGSTLIGVFMLTGVIFLHDACTYNTKVRIVHYQWYERSISRQSASSMSMVCLLHHSHCIPNVADPRIYLLSRPIFPT